jgi:hypothetical protein
MADSPRNINPAGNLESAVKLVSIALLTLSKIAAPVKAALRLEKTYT